MLGLEAGLLLVRQKWIFAINEHELVEVPHECFLLHVEVPKHIVSAPAANQIDDVHVKAQTEEGHGNSGVQRAEG